MHSRSRQACTARQPSPLDSIELAAQSARGRCVHETRLPYIHSIDCPSQCQRDVGAVAKAQRGWRRRRAHGLARRSSARRQRRREGTSGVRWRSAEYRRGQRARPAGPVRARSAGCRRLGPRCRPCRCGSSADARGCSPVLAHIARRHSRIAPNGMARQTPHRRKLVFWLAQLTRALLLWTVGDG